MTILKIINQYPSLRKALKHIILNNTANNAPYHNLNHLLTVTRHCYNACQMDTLVREEELLLAALFHDFNHSQGKEKDDVNVSAAKKELSDFIRSQEMPLHTRFMESILDATQYPYVIPSEDLNPYQKIIRDCDLCQIYEYDWLKQNIFGLSKEMNIPVTDLIPGQRKFLEAINPLTKYGKYMHKKYFKDVMEELEILEDIIN